MPFKFSFKKDDRKLKKLVRDSKKLEKTEVEWGWINGKAYPKSDINGRGGVPYAVVATANEFGQYVKNMKTGKFVYIPPRPYFRQSIKIAKSHASVLSRQLFTALSMGEDLKPYLEKIGQSGVDSLKQSISMQNMKPLHPKTIAYKKSAIQWKDTGKLVDNISHKVIYKRAGYGGTK